MSNLRHPAVAGTFYYLDREMLREQAAELVLSAKEKPRFRAVISPHAGYPYSGKTAAKAIASLLPAKTFIILGPNHTGLGKAFSIMTKGEWETPLGKVSIDSDVAKKLCKEPVEEDPLAHYEEHSIEIQLPLLQQRFHEKGFSMVPITILNISYSDDFLRDCVELGKRIASLGKEFGRDVGIIASSDFSHYIPLSEAKEKDRLALEKILALDPKGLFKVLPETSGSVCGYGPIAVLLAAAKRAKMKPHMISSSSSADVTKDESSVVTYYAVGFE